jgi:hypothetical protein
MRLVARILPALLLLASALPAKAAQDLDRKVIVSRIAELLEEMYVDPKTGREVARHLRSREAAGAFDGCASPAALADALTRAMREIANDKHLSVRYGQDAGFPSGGVRIERDAPGASGPAPPGAVRRVVVGPDAGPGPAADRGASKSGVSRVERLEGNVGYLALTGFFPGDRHRDAVASAMNVLEDTEALVVDVTRCPGGTPGAVLFLESYFFPPEPKEMITRYDRPMDRTEREVTLQDLPGKRRPDIPLFIVTGAGTGSGCEAFAYTLQKHGRATVVGERTAGAGYNNVLMPAGGGLTASISVARPIHPKTGRGWEGTGVGPDVPLAPDRAVAAERRRALEWALEGARSRENPVQERPEALQVLAGHYGAREISVANGGLYYRSAGGHTYGPLLPLSGGRFLSGEDFRLSFERGPGGVASALAVERPDGTVEKFSRGGQPGPEAPCAAGKGTPS